jgi:hypothetical protein
MIEKISLGLINESGDCLEIEKQTFRQIESKIEIVIADLFSAICFSNNDIADDEIKIAEKFHFAMNLKNYLKELKENASR